MTVILQGVVGSTAYGLDHADSDVDRLAVHLGPLQDVLTFGLSKSQQTKVTSDPDSTSHEVAKFMSLVMKGNPTVTEMLFLQDYEIRQHIGGDWLIHNRSAFLSAKAVRDSYEGYAMQQLKRLLNRGDSFSSDTRKRKGKHARHCLRLMMQGTELLKTGSLTLMLTKEQQAVVWSASDLAESDKNEALRMLYTSYDWEFSKAYEQSGVLPEHPDREKARAILLEIRHAQYEGKP